MRTTVCPPALNSGETMSPQRAVVTAKEISVGGTSRSSKVPLMESLPPTAATPMSIWALKAPSTAERGWLQRFPSLPGWPKYSWKVRYTSEKSAPVAMSLAMELTTAR